MRSKRNKSGGIKKAVSSLAAVLVFALPFVFTAQWVLHVAAGTHDSREVFSQSEVASFHKDGCGNQPEGKHERDRAGRSEDLGERHPE